MSADPLLNAIGTYYADLGYQTVICAEPTYRSYSPTLPTVYVSPYMAPDDKYMAFGFLNVKQRYRAAYIDPNSLSATPSGPNDYWAFSQNTWDLSGTPSGLIAAGAWYVRVKQPMDYDKRLFKDGVTHMLMEIDVNYIQNN